MESDVRGADEQISKAGRFMSASRMGVIDACGRILMSCG